MGVFCLLIFISWKIMPSNGKLGIQEINVSEKVLETQGHTQKDENVSK